MKSFLAIAALGALALAASARAATVNDLVGALCPDIAAAVTNPDGDFTTLFAALQAAGEEDIGDLPAEVVVVAPTNAAFAAALKALGVTTADLLADKETLLAILANHVAGVDADGVVTTVAGEALDFDGDGPDDEEIAGLPASGGFDVTSEASGAGVEAAIRCPGQTVLAADAVLVPAALANVATAEVSMPGMAPAPAAEMDEEMAAPSAAPAAEAATEAVAAVASSARKAAVAGAAVLAAVLLA